MIAAPFNAQRFTANQLADLKNQLSSLTIRDQDPQAELQNYLERRWTPARIKEFCQPETRMVPGWQNLVIKGKKWKARFIPIGPAS